MGETRAKVRAQCKPEIQTGPLPGGDSNANQNGSRRRRSAMARALARLYGILRDASAGKCHRRHLAADRRAGTPRFRAGSPSKRAGSRNSPISRRARQPFFRRPYAIWSSSIPPGAEVADFGAWQAPRGEGPILPIEPCDGKSDRQRRSPSLYRSILWSGDRTCETPKS